MFDGEAHTVVGWNVDHLILENKSGAFCIADVSSVTRMPKAPAPQRQSLTEQEDELIQALQQRVEDFDEILALPRSERGKAISNYALREGIGRSTVYRQLSAYAEEMTLSSQLRRTRKDKGQHRMSSDVEQIISKSMKKDLIIRTGGSIRGHLKKVNQKLAKSSHKRISYGTLWARYHELPERARQKRSKSGSALREATRIKSKKTRLGNEGPLSVVMIDHTKADVILVDEEHRAPIGRAYLTVVLDIFSRMILGFWISLDQVGMLSTGQALYHAIMPKKQWLSSRGMRDDLWPCYGLMSVIHTDNAAEFKGKALKYWADDNSIKLQKRRIGLPSDGGAIESGFKTWMTQFAHELPGTTFGGVKSKYDYDSDGRALVTVAEFDLLFTIYVTKIYHETEHSGIGGLLPRQRWHDGIVGTATSPALGVPKVPGDPQRLWVTLLPQFSATVTNRGVQQHTHRYMDSCLLRWVNARDPKHRSKGRLFVFHFDPRSLKQIWFIDPETDEISAIPWDEPDREDISLWEDKALRKAIRARGQSAKNYALINEGIEEMDSVRAGAAAKNKKARLNAEKRADRKSPRQKIPDAVSPPAPAVDHDEFAAFDDLENLELSKVTRWTKK